jgi:Domain of Unknown function (DUF542)/Uncharacterized conserved protein (DUF2249)
MNDTTLALDVRPVLARGEDPFVMIMEAAASVPTASALELTAPFEPVPLYAVLSTRGFTHVARPLSGGGYLVRFIQTGIVPSTIVGAVHEQYPATACVFAAHGIDLCCGGSKTLEFAAKAHGIDVGRLLAEIQRAAVDEMSRTSLEGQDLMA